MKTSSVSLLLTAALLLVPALAQEEMAPAGAKPDSGGSIKKSYKEHIKPYDKNGDGRLDEDEKAAAHAAMRKEGGGEGEKRKQMIKRFDKDGDGQLNEGERATAEEFKKKFDADGDGRLSESEREMARKETMGGKPGKGKKDR